MNFWSNRSLLALITVLLSLEGCSYCQENSDGSPNVIAADQKAYAFHTVLPILSAKRVVFIGEYHDRYDHHLNQTRIIRYLHEKDAQLVIALEMFQQPFQPALDAYVAGRLSERQLLEKTEYLQRWGFDYRLYRPILRYAKQHGIPLLALNIPSEITRKVAHSGLVSLTKKERFWVPQEMDTSNAAYRRRLKGVFAQHAGFAHGDFENFFAAQLLWDEAMASQAAGYLEEHPQQRMVVLAGNGHLAFGAGIAQRLQRRLPVDGAIVLQNDAPQTQQEADYWLLSCPLSLPPSARLGLVIDPSETGLQIQRVMPQSGAQRAGLRPGDRLIAISGRAIRSLTGVQLSLMDKSIGDSIQVTVQRNAAGNRDILNLAITLTE
jgi:uncharacterized iron-regulated protein